MAILIKNAHEIELMRQAGKIVAMTHQLLEERIQVGMTTYELNKIAEDYIKSCNAVPSFKGYNGYPASICVSINDEVVHGIPSKRRKIEEGNLVSIDIGAIYKGYHGDAARTHAIGRISEQAARLIKITKESFFEGIKFAIPGCHLYQISDAIQKHVEKNGYSVVRDLVGHGIGKNLHEEPQIPNYKPNGRGPKLQNGMVLAIEPMVNLGRYEVRILEDDWTVTTLDHSLSAHYENTVLITDRGNELLTVV